MSNKNPLVTYILLSYNHEKYLEQALLSVVNQSYDNIQIIVVDDGSTDNSVHLLGNLKNKYNFELYRQNNRGVVAALNFGIEKSKGCYIVPHATDDFSEEGRTFQQVELMENNNNLGFCMGAVRTVDECGRIIDDWPAEKINRLCDFEDFVLNKVKAHAVSCMYRASCVKKIMPLDDSLSFEDVQLYWRILDLGVRCMIDYSINAVNYRVLRNSLGRSNKIKHWNSLIKLTQDYKDRDWFYEKNRSLVTCLIEETARKGEYNKLLELIKINYKIIKINRLHYIAAKLVNGIFSK